MVRIWAFFAHLLSHLSTPYYLIGTVSNISGFSTTSNRTLSSEPSGKITSTMSPSITDITSVLFSASKNQKPENGTT